MNLTPKQWNIIWLAVILLITAVSIYILFLRTDISHAIKLGLDLRSGTHMLLVVEKPKDNPNYVITDDDIAQTIQVLTRRLNPKGVSEIIIQRAGSNKIVVDIPEQTDPQEAIKLVTKTAYLEFKVEYYDPITDTKTWKTVLTGKYLKRAKVTIDSRTNMPVVAFEMNAEGARKFAEITREYIHKPIGIFFDGELISAPTVQSVIPDGRGIITLGTKDFDEALKRARELANYLNAGALPLPIRVDEVYTVGPTLGLQALILSLRAGIIALLVVCLFMIVFYKLSGLLADIALVLYALIFLAIISVSGTVLTLPGVAGIILSIGMAVDANILIFERIKEELREDKKLNLAVKLGFERAFPTILDSHLTTMIAAAILYLLGSSTIKGFGFTLFWGTAISFFTAIYITKALMEFLILNNFIKSEKILT